MAQLTRMLLIIAYLSAVWTWTHDVIDSSIPVQGHFPCKMYNMTCLDCANRHLGSIPRIRTGVILSIDLSYNNFTTLEEPSFSSHPELLYLHIRDSNIREVTDTVFQGLCNLQLLSLGFNNLKFLPANLFYGLLKLEYLDISANLLTSVPTISLSPLVSLLQLDLSSNEIEVFRSDHSMISLSRLQKLSLDNMNSKGILDLPSDAFQYLTGVTELELLLYERITLGSDVFKPLSKLSSIKFIHQYKCSGFDALESLKSNLTTLFVRGPVLFSPYTYKNPCGDILRNTTFCNLGRFPFLRSLSLCAYGWRDVQDGAFSCVSQIHKLDLSGNELQTLSSRAFEGLVHLNEIDLSFNSFYTLPSEALESLKFLQVLHMQYNPIVNHNATNFSKPFSSSDLLQELQLRGTKITEAIPQCSFEAYPSLKVLDIAGSDVSEHTNWTGLWNLEKLFAGPYSSYDYSTHWDFEAPSLKALSLHNIDLERFLGGKRLSDWAPDLENLSLSEFAVPVSLGLLQGCRNIKVLDLDNNHMDSDTDFYDIPTGNGWLSLAFPRLVVLSLSNNRLNYLKDNTFAISPLIKDLDLSENEISTIDTHVFSSLLYLQKLDLSNNQIVGLTSLNHLSSMHILYAAFNKITEIPQYIVPAKSKSSILEPLPELDLSGNPLRCSCEIEHFQKWIATNKEVFLIYEQNAYDCASPELYLGVELTDVELNCKSKWIIYLSISVAFILLISILGIFVLKYRWHMRYKFFLLFQRREGYIDNDALIDSEEYDVFVSYNENDEEWVLRQLLPKMEEVTNPLKLFIGARDFPVGDCILDCIVDGIQRSLRTLLILSPSFMESEWCYFEMQMAQQRLFQEGRDVLALVLLEEIPDEKMTMLMRQMLCQRDYFKWPNDNLGQSLFWEILRRELRKPTRVDRKNDV